MVRLDGYTEAENLRAIVDEQRAVIAKLAAALRSAREFVEQDIGRLRERDAPEIVERQACRVHRECVAALRAARAPL
jgi:hypothetical protein